MLKWALTFCFLPYLKLVNLFKARLARLMLLDILLSRLTEVVFSKVCFFFSTRLKLISFDVSISSTNVALFGVISLAEHRLHAPNDKVKASA
ncbi:hypothetical protein DKT75_16830 [Leucothrix arctica]|uniref:Uncharacterized protein n=1 Tax=Leucothrix arctica TaxID=1481894 RepID=A0A317C7A9_9GAMM|nr:hypothetical protein DKT75_16830 [Leucothrix arctica]